MVRRWADSGQTRWNWTVSMNDWIEYEAIIYALGGEIACPDCGMGLLIPIGTGDAQDDTQRLVCDEVFELADDDD